MSAVDLIVPIGSLDAHRLRAWNWVRTRYAMQYPQYNLVIGRAPEEPWVKANAVADGLARSTADTIIVADADVWVEKLDWYVDVVSEGGMPWACPHMRVWRFNLLGTSMVVGGMEPVDVALCRGVLDQGPYQRMLGGGVIVLHRALYDEVPIDGRFQGWGGEDASWGLALATLGGKRVQGQEILWHLWHPPQERANRAIGNERNEALYQEYRQAAGNVEAMQALVAGGREWRLISSTSYP